MLPSGVTSTALNRVLPLPEPVDDRRAAGVSTDASQAAQDPDHIPVHNSCSLGPGAGITTLGCAPNKEGSWDAPRMERDTHEVNPQTKLGEGCDTSQSVGGRVKHNPEEPLACETLSGIGPGSRGADVFTGTSSHLSIRDGCNGSRRVSTHARQQLLQVLSCPGHPASQLGHHLAGKGLSSAKQWGGCVQVPILPMGRWDPSLCSLVPAAQPQQCRAEMSQHQPSSHRGV